MVALVKSPQAARPTGRLTLQTAEIAPDTTAIRCLDWDRDRFDIEFELRNGTTYNSFLVRGDKLALIDTSHGKFHDLYLNEIAAQINWADLDYLIVNHTEPDHSGLVKAVLQRAPQVTVVGSKVAIQFLQNLVHQPFESLMVKSGSELDLGRGHRLEFVSAPNLHWPDTIFTYDTGTRVLFTCDVFGMHYCDDCLTDEMPHLLEADFQTYYDCLMGPNARSVVMALKRIEKFEVDLIATGHGPLLLHHRADWVDRYRTWSQTQTKAETFVALFYTEDYGHSDRLVRAIADGINVNVTLLFSVQSYVDSAWAYIRGLEKRVERGEDISRLASVASFFLSRIDTKVDDWVDEQLKEGIPDMARREKLTEIKGKVAIANAKLAYKEYEKIIASDRWQALAQKGANVQRLLWASTSTKNPEYSDVMYVDELVGPDTVNTMPPNTIEACADHCDVDSRIKTDVDKAEHLIASLEGLGLN
ncbi:hypothetical protein C7271_23120, partial [filamentous cyanobacterium CCP5]